MAAGKSARVGARPDSSVTPAQVEQFETMAGQLTVLHQEFAVQAKAKPDNAINKFKLKMLNEKLASANVLLVAPFKPFAEFDQFDEADMPTNSDVAMVLSTYLSSLERWRSAHVVSEGYGSYRWRTKEGERLDADAPTRFNPSGK